MNKILVACFLGLSLWACGNKSASTPAATAAPAETALPPGEILYPAIVAEEMQVLVEKTTLVDLIFYDKNFSMNLDNKPAIMNALRQISDAPAPIRKSCKPTGRIIYQGNGDILKEADFYFEHPCFYFIFIEDDKPVKANLMTEEGAKFFNRLISGVNTQPQ